jgi:hypothetical protein
MKIIEEYTVKVEREVHSLVGEDDEGDAQDAEDFAWNVWVEVYGATDLVSVTAVRTKREVFSL